MKNLLVLFAAVLFLSSCDDDFKVGADYKEVTIVYGLLDHGSPTGDQYIKITKGFYSDIEDNLLLAANKDSLYFRDLTVTVEELSNGNVTQTFTCNKVDLYSLPDPFIKKQGIFLDSPNYAYVFNASLDANKQYKLIVKNNESGKIITGNTNIITTSASFFTIINPFAANGVLQFSDPDQKFTFSWKAPTNAELFDILIRFHYSELNLTTNVTVKKSVDFPLASFIPKTSINMSYRFENSQFYSLLTANIGAAGNNFTRRVDTPELFFIAGDAQMKQYIDVNNAQGGLTSDQIKPIFTNLQGTDVLGIFACRATRKFGIINFDDATYDSIIAGSKTRNLNFIGRSLD